MRLFFDMFHPKIPTYVLLIVFSAAFIISLIQYKISKNRRNAILTTWIATSFVLMFWMTVLGRMIQENQVVLAAPKIHLIPFWSIGAIQDGYIETLYEKIYNVLFFMPYGGLLAAFMGSNSSNGSTGSNGSKGFKGAVLIGFLTSVGIELLQLITRTGTCETDDVICNTVGCALGAGMACLILRIYRMLVNGK